MVLQNLWLSVLIQSMCVSTQSLVPVFLQISPVELKSVKRQLQADNILMESAYAVSSALVLVVCLRYNRQLIYIAFEAFAYCPYYLDETINRGPKWIISLVCFVELI